MRIVWILLSSIGDVLQLLLIVAMVRGGLKKYRVLFVYVVVLFLTTVVEAAAFYDPEVYARVSKYYWAMDLTRQALIFLVVLSFIHQALVRSGRKLPLRVLWAGAALFVLVVLFATRDPRAVYWSRSLSRDLGFLAAVLTFVLWAILIQFRRADLVLLTITGGMGIQMAGKAIGYSLRRLSSSTVVIGDVVIVLSHILCLYIWWQAFRRPAPERATRPS